MHTRWLVIVVTIGLGWACSPRPEPDLPTTERVAPRPEASEPRPNASEPARPTSDEPFHVPLGRPLIYTRSKDEAAAMYTERYDAKVQLELGPDETVRIEDVGESSGNSHQLNPRIVSSFQMRWKVVWTGSWARSGDELRLQLEPESSSGHIERYRLRGRHGAGTTTRTELKQTGPLTLSCVLEDLPVRTGPTTHQPDADSSHAGRKAWVCTQVPKDPTQTPIGTAPPWVFEPPADG